MSSCWADHCGVLCYVPSGQTNNKKKYNKNKNRILVRHEPSFTFDYHQQPSFTRLYARHRRDPWQLLRHVFSRKVDSSIPEENLTTTPSSSSSSPRLLDYAALQQENDNLRQALRQLELEQQHHDRLHPKITSKIILERFEREPPIPLQRLLPHHTNHKTSWYDSSSSFLVPPTENKKNNDNNNNDNDDDKTIVSVSLSGDTVDDSLTLLWCDELTADGDDTCPIEPTISFLDAAKDRAYWLVGLLILQSCSGFILSHNEALLERHPVIIYFLTMLVGAGGNAGNQASVRGMCVYVCVHVCVTIVGFQPF